MIPQRTATIVTYHFVRPAAGFPRLAALDVAAFREQLRYITRHYAPVRLRDIIDAARDGAPLPPNAIALTFDDGYRDHGDHAFPLLAEHGVPATFFVTRAALAGDCVLDVNKVQFVLAAAGNAAAIAADVDRAIEREVGFDAAAVAGFRSRWRRPSRFDTADTVYVKRMLQHGLPDPVRSRLLDALFRRHVTADEAGFARDLYLSVEDARALGSEGVDFGAHGDRHVPLPALDRAGKTAEIDGALEALDAIGTPRERFLFSYVKGEHDAESIELLRARGCGGAVTTRPALVEVSADHLLTLPRLDTNDLPADGAAAPNAWTVRARGAAPESA